MWTPSGRDGFGHKQALPRYLNNKHSILWNINFTVDPSTKVYLIDGKSQEPNVKREVGHGLYYSIGGGESSLVTSAG